jgi:adenine-specific DNA-methyltransferase
MKREVFTFLKDYSTDQKKIDRLIVSAFLYSNEIKIIQNKFINQFLIEEKDEDHERLIEFLEIQNFSKLEDLIQIFEYVISPVDKVVNGAVYTPYNIRDYIITQCTNDLKVDSRVGDISCGCGGFLLDMSQLIKSKFGKAYQQIFKENIFGVDITSYSIVRSKIILSLLAIIEGEDIEEFTFNLYTGNSLEFDWFKSNSIISKNLGFDIIIGNPPYVGVNNIDEETKALLPNWKSTHTGKPDLYIPFFEIGYSLLNPNGILGYITVNTFLKSFNGRAIRNYFNEEKVNLKIVDFGSEQIFKGRRTYTCIVILQKTDGNISYLRSRSSNLSNIRSSNFNTIYYSELEKDKSWILQEKEFIDTIENTGKKLGDLVSIRNGFATLRNNIYLFNPENEDESYYHFCKDGVNYKVEKNICRDAIKPNILKKSSEIGLLKEKIIYPYIPCETNDITVIPHDEFKSKFPYAYNYLLNFKTELAKRDKGKKKYSEWYAYGRNQALNIEGKRLLFPYLTNQPHFVYSSEEDLLFYNGFALISESKELLLLLQKILYTDFFWKYITFRSRPYENGYYSVAKNYIKDFGIYQFSELEKHYFLGLNDKQKVESFLLEKYKLQTPVKKEESKKLEKAFN